MTHPSRKESEEYILWNYIDIKLKYLSIISRVRCPIVVILGFWVKLEEGSRGS